MIQFDESEHSERDVLGQVYEYFLGNFASAEGKKGGEFYTPKSVVETLVEMIEPYNGRCTIHAVVRVVCLYRAENSLKDMAEVMKTSMSMVRNPIPLPGNCVR